MARSDFTDAITDQVLGLDAFVARLEPASEAGAQQLQRLEVYGTGDEAAWRSEMKRVEAVETWRAESSERAQVVDEALAQLPRPTRPLTTLRAGGVLDDGQLFCIKRFLYYAAQVVEGAHDLLETWGLEDGAAERFDSVVELIHPGGGDSPRFHLADELSDEIGELRQRLRRRKRELRTLRRELEEDVKRDYGGTFDINGRYHPGDQGRAQMALERDERLVSSDGAWRLGDEELASLKTRVERLAEELEEAEHRVRAALSKELVGHIGWLERIEQLLAALDVRLAKVRLREELDGCWPTWREEPGCAIEKGREPLLVAQLGPEADDQIQPVDVELDGRAAVVTGPNMGGKSVLLRLIGVCQWAAQRALPVPAARFEFAPVASIVYVGSEEPGVRQADEGLSSFGREVARLVDWLERAERPALWLLDEVGRGTHPEEGAQIARDVVASLFERGDRVVCATHFPALARLDGALKLRIAGLTDPDRLADLLERDDLDVEEALRRSMDYRPTVTGGAEVPRDARVVAQALGLDVDG